MPRYPAVTDLHFDGVRFHVWWRRYIGHSDAGPEHWAEVAGRDIAPATRGSPYLVSVTGDPTILENESSQLSLDTVLLLPNQRLAADKLVIQGHCEVDPGLIGSCCLVDILAPKRQAGFEAKCVTGA